MLVPMLNLKEAFKKTSANKVAPGTTVDTTSKRTRTPTVTIRERKELLSKGEEGEVLKSKAKHVRHRSKRRSPRNT